MAQLLNLFTRPLTTSKFDGKLGQHLCWAISILILALGFYKISQLPLNEKELFLAVLLVLTVSMLGVLIGLVLPLATLAPHQSPTE